MKRGRLKTTTLPIPVDEIASDVQRTFDDELEWGISVMDRGRTTSGHAYAKGRAALRKEIEHDIARVREDDENVAIDATTLRTHRTEFGEWLAIDDGWIVVSDEWVAGIVSTQISGHPEDATLDLQSLLDTIDTQDVWQMGFAGRGVVDGGSKGILYGSNVDEDPDLGAELQHTPLNELGIEHLHESLPVKSYFAADTGYVEVYDSEFTTNQFVEYLCRHVVNHVKGEDSSRVDTEKQEQDTDESQATLDDAAETLSCENCPQESESVQETRVGDGEYLYLCIACRDYYYEKGEIPDKTEVGA